MGQDLKADLGKINVHFAKSSDVDKEKGVMRFADYPPTGDASLVAEIWERHGFGSRSPHRSMSAEMAPEAQKHLVDELRAFIRGDAVAPHAMEADGAESVSIERRISRMKGSWWQLSKDLPEFDDE